ncbi:MAG TPA: WD40 repeat domain-containing protein [Fimbriiglobus sp.]
MLLWFGFLRPGLGSPPDEVYIPGEEREIMPYPNQIVQGVAISPDGKLMAAAGPSLGFVHVWDALTGQTVASPKWEASGNSITFSPDGRFLAVGGTNALRIWKVGTWVKIATLIATEEPEGYVTAIAFSHDGSHIAACGKLGGLGGVRVWEMGTWALKSSGEGFPDHVNSLSFSPDGLYLAAGSSVLDTENPGDNAAEVILWRTSTEQVVHRHRAHGLFVESLGFSPNGQLLATSGCDSTGNNSIRIWEVSPWRELHKIHYPVVAHVPASESFKRIMFLSDGTRIVAGGFDGRLRIIDSTSGQTIRRLTGGRRGSYEEPIFDLAATPDNRTILTAHYQSVKLWTIP